MALQMMMGEKWVNDGEYDYKDNFRNGYTMVFVCLRMQQVYYRHSCATLIEIHVDIL